MTSIPKFGGFYELQTTVPIINEMPVGRAYGTPIYYAASHSVVGVTWVYCLPENEEKFEKVLDERKIAYEHQADRIVAKKYAHPDEQPVKIKSPADPIVNTLMERWTNGRISQMFQKSIAEAFKLD